MNRIFTRAEDGECYMNDDVFKHLEYDEETEFDQMLILSFDYAARYEEILDYIDKEYSKTKDFSVRKELEKILNKFDKEAYKDL